jgi:hypothetical protein
MRTGAIVVAAVLVLIGCGGGSDRHESAGTTGTTTASAGAANGQTTARLPPGSVGPVDTAEEQAAGPAATEASPEAPAQGPVAKGELPSGDQAAVVQTVGAYIAALDARAAGRVCSLFAPGALDRSILPERHGGCPASLRASIGTRPRGGGPAWRRTRLASTRVERLSDERSRVSATVVHRFSDRNYASVEDDVIYLERAGRRWLVAKPSATLYRAVGYAEPPLQAFSPPSGW